MLVRWFFAAMVALFPVQGMAGHDCLRLVFPGGSQDDTAFVDYISKTLTDGGICNEVSVLPPKRATRDLLLGYVDGEIGRAADYGEEVGDVAVMVPTPGLSYDTFLVTHLPDVSRLKQLDFPDVHIGVVRGWVWMEEAASDLRFAKIRRVEKSDTALQMFENGRLDAIFVSEQALALIRERNPSVTVMKLGTVDIHIWLHKKHVHMVDALDTLLRERNAKYGSFIGPDFQGGASRR